MNLSPLAIYALNIHLFQKFWKMEEAITPIERKRIASSKYSSNGEAIREMIKVKIKIPLSPPLEKGDKKQFSPLAKGN